MVQKNVTNIVVVASFFSDDDVDDPTTHKSTTPKHDHTRRLSFVLVVLITLLVVGTTVLVHCHDDVGDSSSFDGPELRCLHTRPSSSSSVDRFAIGCSTKRPPPPHSSSSAILDGGPGGVGTLGLVKEEEEVQDATRSGRDGGNDVRRRRSRVKC